MQKQLKLRQLCFFMIAFFPISKLFMMASIISSYSNEDMWISALINLLVDFLIILFSIFLTKRTDKTFVEILNETFGKTGEKIILSLFLILFLFKAIIPINETQTYIQQTLYITSPKTVNFLPFFALSFYFCIKKTRLLGRISDFLFFITLTGYILLFFLSIESTDFGAILPIGANGITKILNGSIHSLTWFSDAIYILFLVGNFKKEKHTSAKIISSFLISAVMIIVFTIIFYGIFLQNSKNQPFALTETTKYDSIINNTERFDYFAIMLVLVSDMFSMCLPLFFAGKLIDRIFNIKKTWISSLCVNIFIFVIVICLKNYFASIKSFILNYIGYYFLFIDIVLTPFIYATFIIKNKAKNKILLGEKINEIY